MRWWLSEHRLTVLQLLVCCATRSPLVVLAPLHCTHCCTRSSAHCSIISYWSQPTTRQCTHSLTAARLLVCAFHVFPQPVRRALLHSCTVPDSPLACIAGGHVLLPSLLPPRTADSRADRGPAGVAALLAGDLPRPRAKLLQRHRPAHTHRIRRRDQKQRQAHRRLQERQHARSHARADMESQESQGQIPAAPITPCASTRPGNPASIKHMQRTGFDALDRGGSALPTRFRLTFASLSRFSAAVHQDSCVHPDTGDVIFPLVRFSAFVPTNVPMV